MQINMNKKFNVKYFFQQSKITDYKRMPTQKVAYIYIYFLNIMDMINVLEERTKTNEKIHWNREMKKKTLWNR